MQGQKTHPAGLIPLLLLLAALAGGASAQAPADSSFRSGSSPPASAPPASPEPAPALDPGPAQDPVRAPSLSRPVAAPSAEYLGWTRLMQAGGGLVGGISFGLLGAVGGAALVSCPDDPDDGDLGCGIAKVGMAFIGGSAGCMLGTSLGIYTVGRLRDRHGWYLAALGGAIAGFALGAFEAGNTDMPLAPGLVLTLGLSNIASLGLYSLTDRVEARLGSASPPPRARKAPATGSTASLRAETRIILLRL